MPIPNAIKYGSTQSDNINKGNFSVGIVDKDYGPTSQTGYYSGIESFGYAVYSWDGVRITYNKTNTNQQLLDFLSNKANIQFSGLTSAISWSLTQSDILLLESVYNNVVMDNLKLYLDADQVNSYPKSGNVWYDLSTNGYTASFVFGPTFNDDYISLDGNDDYIVTSSTNFTANSDFTIEAMIRSDQYISSSGIISNKGYWSSGGQGVTIGNISVPQQVYGYVTTDQGHYDITSAIASTYSWTHVVLRRQSNELKFFVNGTQSGTTKTISGTVNDTSSNIWIGSHSAGSGKWKGDVSTVRIYNKALTDLEIMRNYRSIKTRMSVKEFINRVFTDGGSFCFQSQMQIQRLIDKPIYYNPDFLFVAAAGKVNKSYTLTPSSDFTFSRNGSASYFDYDGKIKIASPNITRFNFDSLTRKFDGLLFEGPTTNLIRLNKLYPFSNGTYNTSSGAIRNAEISTGQPSIVDGKDSMRLTKINTSGTGLYHQHTIGVTASINSKVTHCMISKSVSVGQFRMGRASGMFPSATFNLVSKTMMLTGDGQSLVVPNECFIRELSNGWFYTQFTYLNPNNELITFDEWCIDLQPNDSVGASIDIAYIGAFRSGSTASTAISTPTVISGIVINESTSQATRIGDTMFLTNLESYIGQSEGTVYLKIKRNVVASDIIRIVDANFSYTDSIFIFSSAGGIQYLIRSGNTTSVNRIISLPSGTRDLSIAFRYSQSGCKIAINGELDALVTGTFSFTSPLSRIVFDPAQWVGNNQNRSLETLAIYKRLLSDSELIEITKIN